MYIRNLSFSSYYELFKKGVVKYLLFKQNTLLKIQTHILLLVKPKIEKQMKQLKETKFSTEELTCFEQCFLEHVAYFQIHSDDYYKWIYVGI